MAEKWTLEKLKGLPSEKRNALYRNARKAKSPEASEVVTLIETHDLYREPDGGLPFDHPVMLRIEEICGEPATVQEAILAAEQGLPPLAGMEHRIVAVLGADYGTHYTTHHAGRCIADQMTSRGWERIGQKPMPEGMVARSATTFKRRSA